MLADDNALSELHKAKANYSARGNTSAEAPAAEDEPRRDGGSSAPALASGED